MFVQECFIGFSVFLGLKAIQTPFDMCLLNCSSLTVFSVCPYFLDYDCVDKQLKVWGIHVI